MFFKYAYAYLLITLLIIIWLSLARASTSNYFGDNEATYMPCAFNALCTCSKASVDFGTVVCKNVPFASLPLMLKTVRVLNLNMENTGLLEIESNFLQKTGMQRLRLANNRLNDIPENGFGGLERSLWELLLPANRLNRIPVQAIRPLRNLRYLDLSYNRINYLGSEFLFDKGNSLRTFILCYNGLSRLEPQIFTNLIHLQLLDLKGNNLYEIDPKNFANGMLPQLKTIVLSDNLLSFIPYEALIFLRNLQTLDLSHNIIENLKVSDYNVQLKLDNLHLEYNNIDYLEPGVFKNFPVVNSIYLDGNPIKELTFDAFGEARIRVLYMRNCQLSQMTTEVFESLSNTLEVLDLAGNKLQSLSEGIFANLKTLRELILADNRIEIRSPEGNEMVLNATVHLFKLDLSNSAQDATNLNLNQIRSIFTTGQMHSFSFSNIGTRSLNSNHFRDFSSELEDLQIRNAGLKYLDQNAFKYVRRLKYLDLSDNHIESIHSEAFADIGYSLLGLNLANGYTAANMPSQALRYLRSLVELDFSNNRVQQLEVNTLHPLKHLQILKLHDNRIEQLEEGIFKGDLHMELTMISLDFNFLTRISKNTFLDLKSLRQLLLNDNRIEIIESWAFSNLLSLESLTLRGNKLQVLEDESFQNLPLLNNLDLAYNNLANFSFTYFDQVGILGNLKINVSHNKIQELSYNFTEFGDDICYVWSLDLSYNNISVIEEDYFQPVATTLTHLYLSYNSLTNYKNEVFSNLSHLQWLDISHNRVSELDVEAFVNTKELQIISMSHNYLTYIAENIFESMLSLRVLDLSHNILRHLPEGLLHNRGFEILDISFNELIQLPLSSFTKWSTTTLRELRASNNFIMSLPSSGSDSLNTFNSLRHLDISGNRLLHIDNMIFARMPKLSNLNVSHNPDLRIRAATFAGLDQSLTTLDLSNNSLTALPDISMKHLRELHLANNKLTSLPSEFEHNMFELELLDLSNNNFTKLLTELKSLKYLRELILSGNMNIVLNNKSFTDFSSNLEILDISNICWHTNHFDFGGQSLPRLRSLKISVTNDIEHFSLCKDVVYPLLNPKSTIRELCIEVGTNLSCNALKKREVNSSNYDVEAVLPLKLSSITLSGREFKNLNANTLAGLHSRNLSLKLFNTSISELAQSVFQNLSNIRNIDLDIHSNNNLMGKISYPYPENQQSLSYKGYLTELIIFQSNLTCDCDLRWLEFWLRKYRQNHCFYKSSRSILMPPLFFKEEAASYLDRNKCEDFTNALRDTYCANEPNHTLLEFLRNDLECDWSRASSTKTTTIAFIILVSCLCLFLWL